MVAKVAAGAAGRYPAAWEASLATEGAPEGRGEAPAVGKRGGDLKMEVDMIFFMPWVKLRDLFRHCAMAGARCARFHSKGRE